MGKFQSFILLWLLFAAGCKKDTNTTNLIIHQVGGGSWSFAGVTDTATSCVYAAEVNSNNGMAASNYTTANGSNYTTIRLGFNDTLYTGTYSIVPTTVNLGPFQMSIEIDYGLGGTNGNSWYSSGTGNNQKATVTVANGKVTVTGQALTIYQVPAGNPNSSDTSTVSFNLYAPN
jgi:hypothetical protein